MSEIVAFANSNYQFIGMVLGVVTATLCVAGSVVFRIYNPESDYLFGIESEANPRLVLMLFLSLWAGVLMAMTWIVAAPVVIVGLAVWLGVRLRDWRIVQRARRNLNV